MILPENYQNEILNANMGNRRQFNMIENVNGTVSFVDVSVYDQEGSLFDADDINAICVQINSNLQRIEALELGGGSSSGNALITKAEFQAM